MSQALKMFDREEHIQFGASSRVESENLLQALSGKHRSRGLWHYWPPWWWDNFYSSTSTKPMLWLGNEQWYDSESGVKCYGGLYDVRYVGPDLYDPQNADVLELVLNSIWARLRRTEKELGL